MLKLQLYNTIHGDIALYIRFLLPNDGCYRGHRKHWTPHILTMTTKWQMTNDSHVSWVLTWSSPHLELPEGVGLDPVGGVHLGHGGGQRPYRGDQAAGQSSNKWQTELHVWTDRLEKLVLTNLKFIGFCCWVWKIWGIHGMYSGEIKFISQSHFRENKINNIITNKCNSRV